MAISSSCIAKAAEALIRHPGLSPAARRVGLELLNRIDRKTGLAWPSESRMAEALGVDVRTIRRGKAELAAHGLLTWVRRGTSWKGRTPLYRLALDLLADLAAGIKTRVREACDKATAALGLSTSPVLKTPNNAPRPPVGRTFSPAYLTQFFRNRGNGGKVASPSGFWTAPGTPQGQVLTDQQLDARASSRFWTALQQFGPDLMAQLICHKDADALQAAAIKAERYQQGTGLIVLRNIIAGGVGA